MEFKEGQYIKLKQDIETKGEVILVGMTTIENFQINLYSGMIFQIAKIEKKFKTIFAESKNEKNILISFSTDIANTIFDMVE